MAGQGGVLIVGATSGIGRALARGLAGEGYDVMLAGRQLDELDPVATDLQIRYGIKAECREFEALAFESHADFFEECVEFFAGDLHGMLLCHGSMPEQEDAARDFALTSRMIDINYTASVSLLNRAANHLEERGRGWICAVTSVAGDRGRPGNYLYGSTKAAVSTVLSGMRARLAKSGVAVVDVRPGFVDTSLTWGREGMFLVASPERVARDVLRGIRRNRGVVYTPFFWAGIMAIIRSIPDFVFRRLSL
jgi:decaprenylphospho-beta-D-erythro-pentofuranosid-2-ulose 2-reductase